MSGRLNLTPPLLSPGDAIAIVAPASAVDPALIAGAAERLRAEGFTVRVMPHAAGAVGSFSAGADERLSDLQAAIDDPAVKAILCARGGYGTVHLLPRLRLHRPVWIIGFSDISALHALALHEGIRSIHGSMAKELALRQCPGDDATRRLLEILRTGHMPAIELPAHPLNRPGEAEGELIGGNMAVLDGLAATPYDIYARAKGSILVVEDVSEPIYKIERIFWRLKLAGVLDALGGLIVGQFTEYRPSRDHADMYSMLARFTASLPIPVAYDAPLGHVPGNLPFVSGAAARLTVTPSRALLSEA